MKVNTTTFTIAEYCQQMESGAIRVNRDYQRSSKRWPQAARSFLIDTILHGFPIPKLSLHQKTDLKSKKTIKEIVDGQQRSVAILEFYQNKLRVTGGDFAGKLHSQLEPDEQQTFIDYAISVDIFTGANDAEIREVFRRINSYTVPLNKQEHRHAVFQGLFKWFIFEQTTQYAESFKTLGVFSEQQLARMADGSLLTEFCRTVADGIATAQEGKLNKFYADREKEFAERKDLDRRIRQAMGEIAKYEDIHSGPLMKASNFLMLMLAVTHRQKPVEKLAEHYKFEQAGAPDGDTTATNLSVLAEVLNEGATEGPFGSFVEAASKGTNTEKNRTMRFNWFCRAIDDDLPEAE